MPNPYTQMTHAYADYLTAHGHTCVKTPERVVGWFLVTRLHDDDIVLLEVTEEHLGDADMEVLLTGYFIDGRLVAMTAYSDGELERINPDTLHFSV